MKDDFISASEDGVALIHSEPYTEYIDEEGPTLILSMKKIKENYDTLRQVLEETFKKTNIKANVFFSMKTNPHPEVIRAIKEMGCGIQVVSDYELDLAIGSGIKPEKILLGGLGKDRKTIERALNLGIYRIYLDSLEEFQHLNEIAFEQGNPCTFGIITSQEAGSKVGMLLKIPGIEMIGNVVQSKRILERLIGLHYHAGTQIVDEEPLLAEIKKLVELASLLEERAGVQISSYNLGGGFPEASYLKKLALKQMMEKIRDQFLAHLNGSQGSIELLFEPGRFIVADAGVVLCKINQIKKPIEKGDGDDPWLMLSAGMNVMNPISKARNRFLVANHMNDSYNTTFNICGSLPTRIDIFTKHYPLPSKTSPGDDIIITNAGAYTIPFLMNFCLKPPKIVIINEK